MSTYQKVSTKISTKLRRYTVVKNPKIFRLSSKPFISGDTYRKMANHIFDETVFFQPKDVKKNDVVFVKSDLIEIYFKICHPKIINNYILITHNSDRNITEREISFSDETIIHWFAQNLSVKSNDRISPLPIGFENRRYFNHGKIKNLKYFSNLKSEKKNKILSSFTPSTNYFLRTEALNSTKDIKEVDIEKYDTPLDYLSNSKNYKFVICPPGNGLDTHRLWQGMLTKTVPILKSDNFSKNFYEMGMPILLIKDWSELKKFDKEMIEATYNNFKDYDFGKFIEISFWSGLIDSKKLF